MTGLAPAIHSSAILNVSIVIKHTPPSQPHPLPPSLPLPPPTHLSPTGDMHSVLLQATNLEFMEVITMLLMGGASQALHDLITTSLKPDDRSKYRTGSPAEYCTTCAEYEYAHKFNVIHNHESRIMNHVGTNDYGTSTMYNTTIIHDLSKVTWSCDLR